jgi:hypothetical protein
MTDESTQKLLRRTALIQQETGATTRDAASLAACIATGGNHEYSRRYAAGAANLAAKGHTADELARKLQVQIRSKSNQVFGCVPSPDRPDLTVDPDNQIQR